MDSNFSAVSSVEISKSVDKKSDKYESAPYNLTEGDFKMFLYICIFVFVDLLLFVSVYLKTFGIEF